MKSKSYFYYSVLFGSIGLIASDTFIPSIPSIAQHFSVDVSLIQSAIAIFMLSFCFARFAVSLLSDALGRKIMFMSCFFLLTLGTIACLFAPTEHLFIIGRFFQGVGAGGSNVLARVIIRDLTEDKYFAKYNSLYSMFAVTLMVSAPFVGSLLQTYFNWQASFILVSVLSVVALAVSSAVYQETNIHKDIAHIKPLLIKSNFLQLLRGVGSLKYASLLFASFGAMTAWLASGSVILQEVFHLSYIEFGLCALLVGFFYFIASFLSSKLVGSLGEERLIHLSVKLLIFPPIILVASYFFYDATLRVSILVFSVALLFFATGFIIPNSYSLGVKSFKKIAGMAGAFFGFSQMLGGSIYGYIISCSSSYSIVPLISTMILTLVISALSLSTCNIFRVDE